MRNPTTQENTMGTMVSFKRPDGKELQGYLAEPAQPNGAPAVVVIQEWWGLNDQIRGVADRLAHAGFLALVPDLYRGKKTVEQEEANHLMSALDFGDTAAQDVRGAAQYLKTRAAKVGCVGFCMGGALTLLAAANVPELDAAVTWYGCPPLEYLDSSKIKIPLQGHWATQDEHFAPELIKGLAAKLTDAGVEFEFHDYLARHAFGNEQAVGDGRIASTQYDPVWAQRAWDRTFTFFGQQLR
jgi:carboxymethylenebutenolidase